MKDGIHPTYQVVTVACACGNSFETRSTASRIRLEICSNCHPFYTGRQRLVDTAGRVERFEKRYASTGGKTVERKPKVSKAQAKLATAPKKVSKVLSTAAQPGQKAAKPKETKKAAKTEKAPAKAS